MSESTTPLKDVLAFIKDILASPELIDKIRGMDCSWTEKADFLHKYVQEVICAQENSQAQVYGVPPVKKATSDSKASLRLWRQIEGKVQMIIQHLQLESVGLLNHPNRENIYYHAWSEGHSYGYDEIFSHLEDIAELVRSDIKYWEYAEDVAKKAEKVLDLPMSGKIQEVEDAYNTLVSLRGAVQRFRSVEKVW